MEFYLQDSRGYVGNDVLWWAKGGRGYTTDLSKAEVYSQEDAQAQHNCRESDIPWPKDYIDAKTRPAVDMQYINRSEALEGSGIVLKKPQKPKKATLTCHNCGRFLSEFQVWSGECPNCGCDNRP
jgi:hypothetical protein